MVAFRVLLGVVIGWAAGVVPLKGDSLPDRLGYWSAQRAYEKKNPQLTEAENIMSLGMAMRGIGALVGKHQRPHEEVEFYFSLQAEISKIPGHAQYFAKVIEDARQGTDGVPHTQSPRLEYDRTRTMMFEVLRNLRTPESVAVMGSYLSDEKDRMFTKDGNEDWTALPPNSQLATIGLSNSGLKDRPAIVGEMDFKKGLPEFRAWWDEVKTGGRSFSFEGQNFSYRFEPDGSVETTVLPVPSEAPATPDRRTWLWIGGGVITALAALLGLCAMRSRGRRAL